MNHKKFDSVPGGVQQQGFSLEFLREFLNHEG